MGGSGRGGGGLLSVLPTADDTQVDDADEAGAPEATTPCATAAVDQRATVEANPASEHRPHQLQSTTVCCSSGHDRGVGSAADGGLQAPSGSRCDEAVAPGGRANQEDGEGVAVTRAAAKAPEIVGAVSKNEGVMGNGTEVVEPSRRQEKSGDHRRVGEGGKTPRLEGQGCGCVVS